MIITGPEDCIINNVEIPIDRHSEGFRLITRIQDEAHRFAIEYHRSLRGKGSGKIHTGRHSRHRTGQKKGADASVLRILTR